MRTKKDLSVKAFLRSRTGGVLSSATFEGFKFPDSNFPGNFLILEKETSAYSFREVDCIKEEKLGDGRVRVTMHPRSEGMRLTPYRLEMGSLCSSDNLPAPKTRRQDERTLATPRDVQIAAEEKPESRTLAAVAANWSNSCMLHDAEGNNCAHYLSDAFIKAGFNELTKRDADPVITEWCDWNDTTKNPVARTIRAKEMWAWFKKMAKKNRRDKPSNEGYWAVFQWDPSYSGGHVLLYNSDTDKVFGTTVFWHWQDQYFYQW